jgi:hypothetical protein
MAIHIERREFIVTLGRAVITLPLAARVAAIEAGDRIFSTVERRSAR